MLKALLYCFLASILVSPTFGPDVVRAGMTKEQVRKLLGEPTCECSLQLGVQSSNGEPTFTTYYYEGYRVHFCGSKVDRVEYENAASQKK